MSGSKAASPTPSWQQEQVHATMVTCTTQQPTPTKHRKNRSGKPTVYSEGEGNTNYIYATGLMTRGVQSVCGPEMMTSLPKLGHLPGNPISPLDWVMSITAQSLTISGAHYLSNYNF